MFVPYCIVALGGALGAVCRYMVILFTQNTLGLYFPYGTLIVNVAGSFLVGFLLSLFIAPFNAGVYWRLFLFIGFFGAFTTFSSFAAETLLMFEQGQWFKLLANILANNIGSLSFVLLGTLLARYILLGYVHQP